MKQVSMVILISALCATMTFGQENNQKIEIGETVLRHQVGSSIFVVSNLFPDPADYYILTYGYHMTPKDVLIVETWTWTVYEPIGTYGSSDELYPGKIVSYGVGAGYQRFHWKNFYTTIEATPLMQQYYDTEDKKIQKGWQLYCQFIAGYRFEFSKDRMFIEPALALKYWPIDTNYPDSFAEIEDGTPIHTFEPGLNFGFRF